MTALTATIADPAAMPPSGWKARKASLLSHGASPDDPRVLSCDGALSYWRCRRVIDRERDQLHPEHVPALADMLRHAHPAVLA
jgi:hypothetical protein